MFKRGSLRRGDVNDVIHDTESAREGQYAVMGSREGQYGFTTSRERAVMSLQSWEASAEVTKHFVTIYF